MSRLVVAIAVSLVAGSARAAELAARIQPPASLSLRELGAVPQAVSGAASLPDLANALQTAAAAAQGAPARLAPLLTAADQALAKPARAGQASALAKIRTLRDRLAKDEGVSAALQGFYENVGRAPAGNFVLVNAKGNPELLKTIIAHPDFPREATVYTSELSLVGNKWEGAYGRKGLRRRLTRQARDLDAQLRPFRELAKEKDLKIWVGHPLLEDGRLYNAYSLVTPDGIEHTQRKKFLWKTERWLFSEPEKWEGLYHDCASLVCSEATAFFNILRWDRPTQIPEIRKARPRWAVFPAHWVRSKGFLIDTARTLAAPLWNKLYRRKGGKPFLVEKGARPEGIPVFVVNYNEAAVVAPTADAKTARIKTRTSAKLQEAGWIQVKDGRAKVVAVSAR